MTFDPILRAWLHLLLLSAGSVLLAAGSGIVSQPAVIGALVLSLAWLKARVILSYYLGLWLAPTWRSGFFWVLGIYCLLLLGLYLVPDLIPTSIDRNQPDRVWGLFGKEQVAGQYGLSIKTCDAANSPQTRPSVACSGPPDSVAPLERPTRSSRARRLAGQTGSGPSDGFLSIEVGITR